jgi:hypothetical protein
MDGVQSLTLGSFHSLEREKTNSRETRFHVVPTAEDGLQFSPSLLVCRDQMLCALQHRVEKSTPPPLDQRDGESYFWRRCFEDALL